MKTAGTDLRESYMPGTLDSFCSDKSVGATHGIHGVDTSRPQTPRISFPVAVYSQRGGFLETRPDKMLFVENTLPAFMNAARMGVDLLELDVQLTKDGKVVVFDDHTLGRLFGPALEGRRMIDFVYSDIPLMDPRLADSKRMSAPSLNWLSAGTAAHAGEEPVFSSLNAPAPRHSSFTIHSSTSANAPAAHIQPTPAELRIAPVAANLSNTCSQSTSPTSPSLLVDLSLLDYQVPLLEQIMVLCPGFPIQIDIKVDSPGLVEAVNALVQKHGLQGKVRAGHAAFCVPSWH